MLLKFSLEILSRFTVEAFHWPPSTFEMFRSCFSLLLRFILQATVRGGGHNEKKWKETRKCTTTLGNCTHSASSCRAWPRISLVSWVSWESFGLEKNRERKQVLHQVASKMYSETYVGWKRKNKEAGANLAGGITSWAGMTGDAVGSERLRNKQGQNEETQRKGTYTMDNSTICTLVWVLLHPLERGWIPLRCQNYRFERTKQTKKAATLFSINLK